MSLDERERQEEEARLKRVTEHIRRQLAEWDAVLERRKADLSSIAKHLWDDEITLDPEYSGETAVHLSQQTQIWAERNRNYEHARNMRRSLEAVLPSPYFGRIDFRERGSDTAEPVYIGLRSIFDERTQEHLVYDWRAPISSMYYDYGLGPARYRTPDGGSVEGDITLKRQYKIRDGRIIYMFDTGDQIGDEWLQDMISKSADDKMRNIVATIQREQNRIIRDDEHPVLVVQGAAGSGKTSIALQRVAYLLYRYRTKLRADQIILFSPNRIFSDYISNVLPELGEENMVQMTFQEYVENRVGRSWQIEDRYSQAEWLLRSQNEPELSLRETAIRYKTSLRFLRVMLRYAEMLGREGFMFRDVLYKTSMVFGRERIEQLFYETYGDDPVYVRLEKIKQHILDELEEFRKNRIKQLYLRLRREPKYLGADEELRRMAQTIVNRRVEQIRGQVEKLEFADVAGMYRRLHEDRALFARIASESGTGVPDRWDEMASWFLDKMDKSIIPCEDAPAFLFLYEFVEGIHPFNAVRHVLIDEVQDYSVFQLWLIRRLFPRARLTLLGDLNQTLRPDTGLESYEQLADVFAPDSPFIVRLHKSYRSTLEILRFAQAILPAGEPSEPFARSGEKPKLVIVDDEQAMAQQVSADASSLLASGFQSVAVLCRTAEDAGRAHRLLDAIAAAETTHLRPRLLTKDDVAFVKGWTILPSYLAKGHEFDVVLLWNASADVFFQETERKLFYTMCTRALHRLILYAVGRPSPFMDDIPLSLYNVERRCSEKPFPRLR